MDSELIEILKSFSDETRLRIINLIRKDELCVGFIERVLNLCQSNVSKHLCRLSLLKIANYKKNAQWIYYYLNPEILKQYPFIEELFKELDDIEPFKSDNIRYLQMMEEQSSGNAK